MLLYLDQNYASRIAKYLLGQEGHDHFAALYHRLLERTDIVPPSPFHVTELQGGYLTPKFQLLYKALSRGYWVRPWAQILALQQDDAPLEAATLLTTEGSWETAAQLEPFADLMTMQLTGSLHERIRLASATLCHRLKLDRETGAALPFVETCSKMLAFRSLNTARLPRASDLADLVIAATVQPYVDIFATDRFVREGLDRLGIGANAYSGRRDDVLRLLQALQ